MMLIHIRAVASGGAGGAKAPPVFGRSVNPISTRGDTLSPPSTSSPPGFSDLATALHIYVPVGISNTECINTLWKDSS
jgi:hypothetical protein